MRVIYEPTGRAAEYCPLALNLYGGCKHGCKYCFVPGIRRQTREAFAATVTPRLNVLKLLKRDARDLARAGEKRPIFLCFMCDPYQQLEAVELLTRRALEILGEAGLAVRVLTKNPTLALRDVDIFLKYGFELGVTMVFDNDGDRSEWEPGAPSVASRTDAIRRAHRFGVRTWVSLEPVIYAGQTLEIVEELHPFVRHWKVGKLNHDKWQEAKINWPYFLRDVLHAFARHAATYYVKNDLWAFADDSIRSDFEKTNVEE